MGRIIDQTPATESIYELKDDLFLEIHCDDAVANTTGIGPLYDDEIGLCEALEHRYWFHEKSIR